MRTILILLGCSVVAAPMRAQAMPDESPADMLPTPQQATWRPGVLFGVMIPNGEFAHQAQTGGFADVYVSRHANANRSLGWRADLTVASFSFVKYGTTISDPVLGDIAADVNTSDQVFTLTIGPEWMKPTGRVRPYVRAGVGLGVITAGARLTVVNPDDGTVENVASRTIKHDETVAYAASAGVNIGVSRKVLLDVGLGLHGTSRAHYFGHGLLADGTETSFAGPFYSSTRVLALTVGLAWR